jgi:hypothetical protein
MAQVKPTAKSMRWPRCELCWLSDGRPTSHIERRADGLVYRGWLHKDCEREFFAGTLLASMTSTKINPAEVHPINDHPKDYR